MLSLMQQVVLLCVICFAQCSTIRTGVLVHGCHCAADQWERIVWGDTKSGELGRIPCALHLCLRDPTCMSILFGTGASTHPQNGLLEGEATLALARARCCRLSHDFPRSFLPEDEREAENLLETVGTTLLDCSDTHGELRAAARSFGRLGVTRVILVSSPTHLPRCLRDAPCAFAAERFDCILRGGMLLGAPSGTSYRGASAMDVAIVEPPHRPDRATWGVDRSPPELALHRLVQRALCVAPERRDGFTRALNELLHDAGC